MFEESAKMLLNLVLKKLAMSHVQLVQFAQVQSLQNAQQLLTLNVPVTYSHTLLTTRAFCFTRRSLIINFVHTLSTRAFCFTESSYDHKFCDNNLCAVFIQHTTIASRYAKIMFFYLSLLTRFSLHSNRCFLGFVFPAKKHAFSG